MNKRLFLSLLLIPISLIAKPKKPEVVQGTATFSHPTNENMHIRVSDRTIINWESFSIDKGEVTTFKFTQPSTQSSEIPIVLNRVIGIDGDSSRSDMSKIIGKLESDGKIFLINSKGVFIGSGAVITAHSFFTATLDILDSEFITGTDIRFRGNSENDIVNLGTIQATGGDVVLIGRYVRNDGKIQAPFGTAAIAVGKEILLKPKGDEKAQICALSQNPTQKGTGIIQRGDIEALKIRLLADGNPYKLAIKHTGKLDALNAAEKNGEVFLVAEKGVVEVNGAINAPSGKIHVLGEKVALLESGILDVSSDLGDGKVFFGGSFKGQDLSILSSEFTYVHKDAKIDVSAKHKGNSGTAIVWSDGLTSFHGLVIARGGEEGGNGGLVEVSGRSKLDMTGTTDRTAPKGTPGELFTDPSTIIIKKGNRSHDTSYIYGTYYPTTGASILDETTLLAQLNSGPVTVTTSSTFDGDGDIIIDTDLDSTSSGGGYGTSHKLTFIADRDIHIKGNIQNSGKGDIAFNARRDVRLDGTNRIARVGSQLGNTEIEAGRNLLLLGGEKGQAQIGFDTGLIDSDITLKVGSDLILQSLGNFTLIGHTNTAATSSGMDFKGTITIDKLGRDLVLLAGNECHQFAQIGHAPHQIDTHSFTSNASAAGDIHIPNIGGSVKLAAGSGKSGSYALIGHGGRQRSHDDSYTGKFIVHTAKDIKIFAGETDSANNFAGIGFAQDFDGSATHTFHSDHISVKAKEGIYLNAGYGTNPAFIGAYTGNTPGTMDCKLNKLEVSSGADIFLIANSNSTAMGDSTIGITGINGPAYATITVDANETFLLQGGGKSNAVVVNYIQPSEKIGSVHITANDFILDSSKCGAAYVQGLGPTSITSHKTLALRNKSWIENQKGSLTVKSLSNANMSPQSSIANLTGDPLSLYVGYQTSNPGKLTMEKGATLDGSGNISLFLSSKADHDLNDFSNFNLITDEEVKVVLPPEVPRTIFFKDFDLAYRNIERSQLLVSGMLTDLHSMSEYMGWPERFQVADKKNDQLYFLRMRNVSFNNPKNDNLITFPKAL